MIEHKITTLEDFQEMVDYTNHYESGSSKIERGSYVVQFEDHENFVIPMAIPGMWTPDQKGAITKWVDSLKERGKTKRLIFGKDQTQNIVSCEVKENKLELFFEKDGKVWSETRPHRFWMLASRRFTPEWNPLEGNLHYKYVKYYDSSFDFYKDKRTYAVNDIYSISDSKESAMLQYGFTYFKGMKVSDVSIFHFDLETTGLVHDETSKVLLISTTFKRQGSVLKRLFSLDEYESQAAMIEAFCDYVRSCDPSIVAGFNIFGFDFPYLKYVADQCGAELNLGRDGSKLRFNKYTSKFRKDGSQEYDYTRCFIYGREIIDLMFMAYHYDFARKYESYGLKKIIAQEKLEKPGRQFYDASQIWKNWDNLEERAKIKLYCIDDSDDSDSLFNLMSPAYFYLTPSIPKSFQLINCSASGSQINSFLVRSYLQDGHSVPKASEYVPYGGGISDGFPGVYKNVFKIDVASLYPSIMLEYKVYNKDKDPKAHFLTMVDYFTKERLGNKKKAKETKDRYFDDMSNAQKIVINSSYGLLGASGLNFNSFPHADFVTTKGREILKKAYLWASGNEYVEKEKEDENT